MLLTALSSLSSAALHLTPPASLLQAALSAARAQVELSNPWRSGSRGGRRKHFQRTTWMLNRMSKKLLQHTQSTSEIEIKQLLYTTSLNLMQNICSCFAFNDSCSLVCSSGERRTTWAEITRRFASTVSRRRKHLPRLAEKNGTAEQPARLRRAYTSAYLYFLFPLHLPQHCRQDWAPLILPSPLSFCESTETCKS